MKSLRAEVGRLFGRKYVWSIDFEGQTRLHRNRNGHCYVYDFTKIGHFVLLKNGQTADPTFGPGHHYVKAWFNYEKLRQARVEREFNFRKMNLINAGCALVMLALAIFSIATGSWLGFVLDFLIFLFNAYFAVKPAIKEKRKERS